MPFFDTICNSFSEKEKVDLKNYRRKSIQDLFADQASYDSRLTQEQVLVSWLLKIHTLLTSLCQQSKKKNCISLYIFNSALSLITENKQFR